MSRWCADCGANPPAAAGLCDGCYSRHWREGSLDTWVRLAALPTIPALDLSWREDALCAEVDPELFFPEKGGTVREAKSLCACCEVRAECLDWALETRQEFGIFGGVSPRARRRLLGLPDNDDSEEASAA